MKGHSSTQTSSKQFNVLLKQHQYRDLPEEEWPGVKVGLKEVAVACGDQRDWFDPLDRLTEWQIAWAEFYDTRRRCKAWGSGFDWDQVLIIGDYGAKKTTLATYKARHWFGWATRSSPTPLSSVARAARGHLHGYPPVAQLLCVGGRRILGRPRLTHGPWPSGPVIRGEQPDSFVDCRGLRASRQRRHRDSGRPRRRSRPARTRPRNFVVARHVWGAYCDGRQNCL